MPEWSDVALKQLAAWGMTVDEAEANELFDVESAYDIYPDFKRLPAIVFPYFNPDRTPQTFMRHGEELHFCRVRYLNTGVRTGFIQKKEQRYDQPGDSGTHVYFPFGIDWPRLIRDIQEPIIITEGEAKAICGVKYGFPVIALGGVYSFALTGSDELLPELAAIPWRGRQQYIVFDSDAETNCNILTAEARLVSETQTKRGATCYIVRLPPDGDAKVGLDDFLLTYGAKPFEQLLENAPALNILDAKVIALNKSVAWIAREGMVYDMGTREFIKKADFVSGSNFSALKHITVGSTQRSAPKTVSVANTWLTHPHAQRFAEILFRPGEGAMVTGELGNPALNMWVGWEKDYGVTANDPRIVAWLKMTRRIFSNMDPADWDYPIKLLACKMQNPDKKYAKAIVLIGDQGSGKSLWGETVSAAFAPYAKTIGSKEFGATFQPWMENTIWAQINEAEPEDLQRFGDMLKTLISDKPRYMNLKHRPQREIQCYTMFMLTANKRAVGSFSSDDRRMVVVSVPRKPDDPETMGLYRYLGARSGTWHAEGGPLALRSYLLDYDLQGWEPPEEPPETAEKFNAYSEGLTLVQSMAEQMKQAKGFNAVEMWLDSSLAWATNAVTHGDTREHRAGQAALEGMKHMEIRPWYEPSELMLLFPNIIHNITGEKLGAKVTPGQLSRELRDAGINYLVSKDSPRGFMWKGLYRQYLVVCDMDDWKSPLSQGDFERIMRTQIREYGGKRR